MGSLPVSLSAPGGGELTSSTVPNDPFRNILSLRASGCGSAMCPPELVVGGNYVRQAGTSMATPHVSGAAALVLACNPDLTNEDVRHVLEASGRNTLRVSSTIGGGEADAYTALGFAGGLPTTRITSPTRLAMTRRNERLVVSGTVAGEGFRYYKLYAGQGSSPKTWRLVKGSSQQVTDGVIGEWDTTGYPAGLYTLKLMVKVRVPYQKPSSSSFVCGQLPPVSRTISRSLQEVQYVVLEGSVVQVTNDPTRSYRFPTSGGPYIAAQEHPLGDGHSTGIWFIDTSTGEQRLIGGPESYRPYIDPEMSDFMVYVGPDGNGVSQVFSLQHHDWPNSAGQSRYKRAAGVLAGRQ